ncbi:MAG: cyanophycinase [Planctomycetaceae bacterium]
MNHRHVALSIAGLALALGVQAKAQVFNERYSDWPEQHRINGRILVDNGMQDLGRLEPVLARFLAKKTVVCFSGGKAAGKSSLRQAMENAVGEEGSFASIHSARLAPKLAASVIDAADCVYIADDSLQLKELHPTLAALVKRGGMLVVDSSVAKWLGKHYVDEGETKEGLDLLPDCVVHCDSDGTSSNEGILKTLAENPRTVGVRLAAESAFLLSGRKLMAFGKGKTTMLLAAGNAAETKIAELSEQQSRRQNPEEYLADLTQWRRVAIDRDLEPFPGAKPVKPSVENGTLIIVGGGGSPRGMMTRFVELAGGVENARLVYVPCAEQDDVGERHGMVRAWKRMGIKNATFIHTKDRVKANSDEEFLAPLKDATGIFFGGGRQWNFADSYYGTKAHKLMKDVLKRGGVIAGSSAGASIQGRFLARATPIGNFRIMAPGYERGGLGFLTGVAIDQHFTQRGRQKDMTGLMKVYPQLLGIGLDEATAIEVQKSVAKVTGRGRVFFYDTNSEVEEGQPDYIALPAGSSYDLVKREVLVDKREESEDSSAEADDR